jgi:hypothetical protein
MGRNAVGLFGAIFSKHYRTVVLEIKDYILSLDLSKADQDLIRVMGIESRHYTFQRSCLRLGVTEHVFEIVHGKLNTKVISAAYGFFSRIMTEYIDNLSAINAIDAYSELSNASNIYFPLDSTQKVASIFIGKLTENRMSSDDFNTLPQLVDMVDANLKGTIALVKDELIKLR